MIYSIRSETDGENLMKFMKVSLIVMGAIALTLMEIFMSGTMASAYFPDECLAGQYNCTQSELNTGWWAHKIMLTTWIFCFGINFVFAKNWIKGLKKN